MKLKDLANKVGAQLQGDSEFEISGMQSLEAAGKTELAHIESKKYNKRAGNSNAGAFLVTKASIIEDKNLLIVEDVKLAQLQLLSLFDIRRKPDEAISPKAFIDSDAKIETGVTIYPNATVMADVEIGENTVIYPGVVLEFGAKIGKNCILYPNVVIGENCIIGNDNIFYSGVVIGTDGYGYYDKGETRYKIPQIGIVRIGDRVELGANTCIDRAMVGETVIGDDTKFDNLVQMGHNNTVGKKCYIVSQVGVSGSVNIGNNVILAGQVGVADHVNIGDNVFVGAQGGVPSDIPANAKVWNTPCMPIMDAMRVNKIVRKLPELAQKIKDLEKTINTLQKEGK